MYLTCLSTTRLSSVGRVCPPPLPGPDTSDMTVAREGQSAGGTSVENVLLCREFLVNGGILSGKHFGIVRDVLKQTGVHAGKASCTRRKYQ